MMKINIKGIFNNVSTFILSRRESSLFSFILINVGLSLIQLVYILSRFNYINNAIPFWFGKHWGDYQMGPKADLFLLPLTSLLLTLGGAFLLFVNKYYLRYFEVIVKYSTSIVNTLLLFSVYSIIQVSSVPFPPFVPTSYLILVLPFVISFLASYIVLPLFIDYAQRKRLITDPSIHSHPAMILKEPSARGGGFVYSIIFLIVSFIFLGFSENLLGLYLSVAMMAVLGITDDYQNTHPDSDLKILEKPYLRLFLLFVCVLPIVFSNYTVDVVSIPFNGMLQLNTLVIQLGNTSIPLVSFAFTLIWVVWLMNALSWSNGIDGQYAGIIGISSILISILALRFTPLEAIHKQVAIMGAVSGGVAFGFSKYTWHPSKIMWGFGAMSAGMILATLSIAAQTKVIVSVLFIIIPFMDAVVTVTRRLLQRKNPLAGDRGHLHHLLLDNGWSPQKIARFYWITTVAFGLVGLLSPDKYAIQVALSIIGLVGFAIVLLNVRSLRDKKSIRSLER